MRCRARLRGNCIHQAYSPFGGSWASTRVRCLHFHLRVDNIACTNEVVSVGKSMAQFGRLKLEM